jgi:hypothetical protein
MKTLLWKITIKPFLSFYLKYIQPNGIYTYPNFIFLEFSGEEYYKRSGFLNTWEYLFKINFWKRIEEAQKREELAQSVIKGIDYFDDWDNLEKAGFTMNEIQSYIGDEYYSADDYDARMFVYKKMVEIGTIFI